MAFPHKIAALGGDLRIAYIDRPPKSDPRSVILLIHGFPQTSYQYHHVIEPFAASGYRVVVPDYRGTGLSSKPASDFRKTTMAKDLAELLDHLGIPEPVHVVGHDIGGMIAYAFATRHEHRTAFVVWGECPLPGTTAHEEDRTVHGVQQFHFLFHSVPDLPEALVTGREEMYLSHLFDKLTHNRSAISEQDLQVPGSGHYVAEENPDGFVKAVLGFIAAAS
ncbi:Soluble epoxide hydrolase [Colletotrichum sidae]|uniref:Soluble epoxide hydrolase n=1 Tax=Colletotrichum sidae TaxID=1347389 RepID=A0A4R8TTH0_9PEZI|nr:Soluble epoxide hydrolase [Colletotrichum sidae]